jgi:hypothetical protein
MQISGGNPGPVDRVEIFRDRVTGWQIDIAKEIVRQIDSDRFLCKDSGSGCEHTPGVVKNVLRLQSVDIVRLHSLDRGD